MSISHQSKFHGELTGRQQTRIVQPVVCGGVRACLAGIVVSGTLTPNQIVAGNLYAARKLRGWTQEETARHLEPYLGALWSKANYSVAENSFRRNERLRNFSADDLVALAATFELPMSWFFTPPPFTGENAADDFGEHKVTISPGSTKALDISDYLTVVFGTLKGVELALKRIHWIGDEATTKVQQEAVRDAALAKVKARTADLARWRQSLQELQELVAEAEREAAAAGDATVKQHGESRHEAGREEPDLF